MTSKELTARIAEKTGLTKKLADALMAATGQTVAEALNENKTVQLKNFGILETKERAAREVTNPRTGEKTRSQKKRIITFRPNRQLKEQMKQ